MKNAKMIVSLVFLTGLLIFSLMGYAGSLEPSGPPGPTMKTLDEVEPRMPIPASDTPTGTFIISQSGSFYLTGDRLCSGTGIIVNVNDVTINLMGYSLIGPDSGSNYGIYMKGRSNVEVLNGTVRDFGLSGIHETSATGGGHRVIAVRSVSNGSYGLYLWAPRCLVKDCTTAGNMSTGIHVVFGSTVTGNTAFDNQGHGIYTSAGCTVTGNTACNNNNIGIATGDGCTVIGNTAYNNNDTGISAGYGSTIINNTAFNNNQSDGEDQGGIRVYIGCLVKGNTLRGNKQNNIYVYSYKNAIEENLLTASKNGVYFRVNGNFYANNRASDNTTDYVNSAGQTDGGGNTSF